ncbi:MAG: FAD-binding oxidoreductase [Deltaproteobacteria bacterium]|nr:FAD-binding oxidoreductase [Deltaproteobacteria bacterium]MBW2360081.1 FAD-binding oxidoreductase [Deltaproteobacteria bacterium]
MLKVITGGLFVGVPGRAASGAGEPRRVEVAVVGAGLFGASAAMHLAAAGARSVLLIGPAEVVGGTSAAQILASHYDESRNATSMDADPEWAELARSSIEPLRALEKRSQTKILHEVGSLRVTQGHLAEGYFNLDGIRETAAKLDIGLVSLSSATLAARYPEVRFDADSHGLLQERNAGLIRPRRLVAALRKAAVEDGATWIDEEVTRIEPATDHVDLLLDSGTRVRAQRILVATGAAPIGHTMLPEKSEANVRLFANLPTHVEVPEEFETTLPPTMITISHGGEFFGGFVAPPVRYPDGRRYIKAAGQARSLVDGALVSDQVDGTARAVRHLFPSLEPGAVNSRVCMTTDTDSGRPIIDWVDSRIAVAIAGNGRGAKAALEIGRRAAALIASSRRV